MINHLEPKNQQGVILVITMMVMAILLSVAIGFAVFIISDLNQARMIDDSVLAYYSAEAGFERTIYLFRKQDKEKIGDFSGADAKTLGLGDKSGGTLASASTWDIGTSMDFEPIVYRQRLNNGQSIRLYFLNRVDGGGSLKSDAVKSIKINWKMLENCHLQTSFTQLRPQIIANSLVNLTEVASISPDPTGADKVDGTDNEFNPCYKFLDAGDNWPSDYVVELKALAGFADPNDVCVDSLSVQGYNSATCDDSSMNNAITNLTIRSVGTHNKSSQAIIAQLPPRQAASGLLGFVLFSEQDIEKSY